MRAFWMALRSLCTGRKVLAFGRQFRCSWASVGSTSGCSREGNSVLTNRFKTSGSGGARFSTTSLYFYAKHLYPGHGTVSLSQRQRYLSTEGEERVLQWYDIDTQEFVKIVADHQEGKTAALLLVDVREPEELEESGKVPGTVNIPRKRSHCGCCLSQVEL